MSGLSAMDTKASGRLGVLTITYYLWTTFIAVIVGIVLVLIIHPGTGSEKEGHHSSSGPVMTSADALLDLIRLIVTDTNAFTLWQTEHRNYKTVIQTCICLKNAFQFYMLLCIWPLSWFLFQKWKAKRFTAVLSCSWGCAIGHHLMTVCGGDSQQLGVLSWYPDDMSWLCPSLFTVQLTGALIKSYALHISIRYLHMNA